MKQFRKYLLPVGLLCLGTSLIFQLILKAANIHEYQNLSHFVIGFLLGLALVFILFSRLRPIR